MTFGFCSLLTVMIQEQTQKRLRHNNDRKSQKRQKNWKSTRGVAPTKKELSMISLLEGIAPIQYIVTLANLMTWSKLTHLIFLVHFGANHEKEIPGTPVLLGPPATRTTPIHKLPIQNHKKSMGMVWETYGKGLPPLGVS